jgi:excisionase family DNA binding protein
MVELPLMLKVKEVAHLLGVSERKIYRLRDAKEIPAPIKIGHSTRWRRKDIELFVEAGTMLEFERAKRKQRAS